MRKAPLWILALSSIAIWACSSPPPANGDLDSSESSDDDDDKDDKDDDKDNDNKTTTPPPVSTVDSGTTTTPPAGTCSATQGADACYDCCDAKYPGGEDTYFQAFFDCACQNNVCGDECGQSVCNPNGSDPVDGDACSTCLDNANQCYDQADTACEANANCVAGSQCVTDSQCDSGQ